LDGLLVLEKARQEAEEKGRVRIDAIAAAEAEEEAAL